MFAKLTNWFNKDIRNKYSLFLFYISFCIINLQINPVFANTDLTDSSKYVSQIYSDYVWPFVYLIIASTLYMGIAAFIRALLTLGWNSANPNARLQAYRTLFREFVFLAVDGSFGLIFSLVISCLTYA